MVRGSVAFGLGARAPQFQRLTDRLAIPTGDFTFTKAIFEKSVLLAGHTVQSTHVTSHNFSARTKPSGCWLQREVHSERHLPLKKDLMSMVTSVKERVRVVLRHDGGSLWHAGRSGKEEPLRVEA